MKRNIVADLHNHSTASDGEYSPTALVRQAKEIGLQVVALTDHDSISGLSEAIEAGVAEGITVIPGVEFSVAFRRPAFTGTLHVLAYFQSSMLQNAQFVAGMEAVMRLGRGIALVESRVKAINEIFGPGGSQPILSRDLQVSDVTAFSDNVTRRHFALALKQTHGISDEGIIMEMIGNASPAYVPSGMQMEQLKPAIAKYPMIAVLAHPAAGSFPGDSHYKEVLPPMEIVLDMLDEFLDLGIKGIEVHYPGHVEAHRTRILQLAEKYKLLVTGGSDCHDADKRPLGVDGLNEEEWEAFVSEFNKLPH